MNEQSKSSNDDNSKLGNLCWMGTIINELRTAAAEKKYGSRSVESMRMVTQREHFAPETHFTWNFWKCEINGGNKKSVK